MIHESPEPGKATAAATLRGWRPESSRHPLGLDPDDGVLRISLVHDNTLAVIEQLIEVLEKNPRATTTRIPQADKSAIIPPFRAAPAPSSSSTPGGS
jgi:hypothetical protein